MDDNACTTIAYDKDNKIVTVVRTSDEAENHPDAVRWEHWDLGNESPSFSYEKVTAWESTNTGSRYFDLNTFTDFLGMPVKATYLAYGEDGATLGVRSSKQGAQVIQGVVKIEQWVPTRDSAVETWVRMARWV